MLRLNRRAQNKLPYKNSHITAFVGRTIQARALKTSVFDKRDLRIVRLDVHVWYTTHRL